MYSILYTNTFNNSNQNQTVLCSSLKKLIYFAGTRVYAPPEWDQVPALHCRRDDSVVPWGTAYCWINTGVTVITPLVAETDQSACHHSVLAESKVFCMILSILP